MGWNRVQCSRDTVGSCGALHESQCIQWGLECFHIWKRWLHSSYMADNLWQGAQPLGMVHMECLVQGRRQDPWGIALWQSPEYRSKYTPWNWGNEFTIESIHSRVNWRNCTDTMIFCSTLTLQQAKYTVYGEWNNTWYSQAQDWTHYLCRTNHLLHATQSLSFILSLQVFIVGKGGNLWHMWQLERGGVWNSWKQVTPTQTTKIASHVFIRNDKKGWWTAYAVS